MEKVFLENQNQMLNRYRNRKNNIKEAAVTIEVLVDGMAHTKQNLAATAIRQKTKNLIQTKYAQWEHISTAAS